jgi:hypothetical protein
MAQNTISWGWWRQVNTPSEEYHDQQVFHGEEILTQPLDYKGFRQLLSENKAKPQHLGVGGVK